MPHKFPMYFIMADLRRKHTIIIILKHLDTKLLFIAAAVLCKNCKLPGSTSQWSYYNCVCHNIYYAEARIYYTAKVQSEFCNAMLVSCSNELENTNL